MTTSRRKFIAGAAAGGVAGAGAVFRPRNAKARPRVRWNMPTSWPPHLLLQDAAIIVAQRVADITDGAFEIRVYPGGELVPALEVFDAVQAGTVECAHSWGPYYTGRNLSLTFDGGLPFGMNAQQHTTWWYNGGGREAMKPIYDSFNVLGFLCGDTEAQMGGWFNTEINSLDDLRGLRMRVGGLGGQVLSELGVSTQVLPGGEIYTAMERGAIDAVQYSAPYDDEQLGLHRVGQYYYHPCWWQPNASLTLYVNRDAWEDLPEEYQNALEVAASATHVEHVSHSQHEDQVALQRFRDDGVDIRVFPDDVMEAAAEITDTMFEEHMEENAQFAEIYRDWRAYRNAIRDLHRVTRFGFDRFVLG